MTQSAYSLFPPITSLLAHRPTLHHIYRNNYNKMPVETLDNGKKLRLVHPKVANPTHLVYASGVSWVFTFVARVQR